MSDQKPVDSVPEPKPVEAVEGDKPEIPVTAAENTEAAKDEPAISAPAKQEEPAKDTTASNAEPQGAKLEEKAEKPAYLTKTPALGQFFDRLPAILTSIGHDEMWGVQLKDSADVPTVNVLIKFLRANEGNVQAAEDQLRKALQWRKDMNPLALIESGKYSASKYAGLGYLTTYEKDGRPLVFTWNIYGAVKDVNATFADSDEFVKWRAALMELAVQELKMKDATEVIEYDGEDPYQMVQVHDYLNVKFLRMDPSVRTATKKVIDVFATAYPELLSEKFFVNVPAIMGWMFTAMKLILSRNTTRKFHPITNGANLAREFPASVVEQIPKTYGGKGPELKDSARIVPLVEDKSEDKKDKQEDKKAEEPAPAEIPEQEGPKQAT
ncbi:uncharacterized protein N7446_009437 [Penicillium canescens]|uniref:Phosphatidylinositol transfer protein SFH5 n=1 Tax=Penicillium canescens TaxID=5083 RepID=A0AAD6I773_PENCN|nr:uncharacterized protein N7446_009437 [Penicillium canescens]KAJ6034683.1 hypothetical protein N7460_008858 [Penicillium canescens]KAJ6046345.1 hypothetical protein N7444_007599 [Penicillium canescens]KAJ6053425.1 hypothetical protein N7446_009437 [Penicillium canescens]